MHHVKYTVYLFIHIPVCIVQRVVGMGWDGAVLAFHDSECTVCVCVCVLCLE
jgi:hypothetical protein